MATSSLKNVKSLRAHTTHSHERNPQLDKKISELDGRRGMKLIEETARYEKYCKYWSILSNVAAVISLSSTLYATLHKKRFW